MSERKIIFKCTVGSKLYGTDGPDSDTDYCGVFLPSSEDLLGIGNCPTEWTFNSKVSEGPRNSAGDTDCKYYSLPRFLDLAMQGQPGQLEMLFVPESHIHIRTPEWDQILANRRHFISKSGIKPFIGFALAQAHKAEIKGENLNLLRSLLSSTAVEKGKTLRDYQLYENIAFPITDVTFQAIPITQNDFGFPMITVAGRSFDIGCKVSLFLTACQKMVDRYGTRAEAAAKKGQDYKSLSHAYRLISQAAEYLETGEITLPRPDADFIRRVKAGEYSTNFRLDIEERLITLRTYEEISNLPKEPNRTEIRQLCIRLLKEHLR